MMFFFNLLYLKPAERYFLIQEIQVHRDVNHMFKNCSTEVLQPGTVKQIVCVLFKTADSLR